MTWSKRLTRYDTLTLIFGAVSAASAVTAVIMTVATYNVQKLYYDVIKVSDHGKPADLERVYRVYLENGGNVELEDVVCLFKIPHGGQIEKPIASTVVDELGLTKELPETLSLKMVASERGVELRVPRFNPQDPTVQLSVKTVGSLDEPVVDVRAKNVVGVRKGGTWFYLTWLPLALCGAGVVGIVYRQSSLKAGTPPQPPQRASRAAVDPASSTGDVPLALSHR